MSDHPSPDASFGKLSALSIFKSFLSKHWVTVALYIMLSILSFPLESVILPRYYSEFFDKIRTDTSTKTFIGYFFVLTCILTIAYTAASLQHHLEAKLLPLINAHYIDFIYKNVVLKHRNSFADIDMGSLISKISFIPSIMREISSDFVAWVFPRIISIVVINIYFFCIHWKLGLVSIILVAIFYLINMNLVNKCIVYSTDRQLGMEKKHSETNDKLSNLFSIYSAGDLKSEFEQYSANTASVAKKHTNSLKCVNQNKILNTIFLIVLFVVLNVYTSFLFKTNQLSYHTTVAILLTVLFYVPCFFVISESIPDLSHYFGTLTHYDGFLRELEEVERANATDKRPDIRIGRGAISIRRLRFDYGGSRQLFNDLSLEIAAGDHVALVGNSGNGKSTLIKLIMGYYKVDDGMILIDGQDINKYNIDSLRKQICYVNQNSKLFNISIYDNISYGNDLTKDDIDRLVAKMRLGGIFEGLSEGLNASAGINGDKLSGGQKQIVHLLRAVGRKNKIIVMDEPTAAIDVQNREIVLKAIRELSKGKTLILITHDDALLKSVNRVIRIANGKIVSDKSYS